MAAKYVVTDEELSVLAGLQHDLFHCVRAGELPVKAVIDTFRKIIKRKDIPQRTVSYQSPEHVRVIHSVNIGRHRSASAYMAALRNAVCRMSDSARDLMSRAAFVALREEAHIDFVTMTIADMGFAQGAEWSNVIPRGEEMGYKRCLPSDGPDLALDPTYKSHGDKALVAMDSINGSQKRPSVFTVCCHGSTGRWLLGTIHAGLRYVLRPAQRVIFRK